MKSTIAKAFLFALLMAGVYYVLRTVLRTDVFFPEVSAISGFLTVFGALYGILTAFVIFEVWKQYNNISELIDKEAQALEQLYGLILYFRDNKLNSEMKAAIRAYAGLIIDGQFMALGHRERSAKTSQAFERIAELIRHIQFNDDHDSAVFNQVLEHYRELAQTRSERLNKSLRRLPILLKSFIYIASFFTLLTFSFMPFSTSHYGLLAMLIISFQQVMIFFIIEGLDNPFVGQWRLTPEPFERALQHIDGNY
jgi:hypothetical protein